jgi:hypothetical protein
MTSSPNWWGRRTSPGTWRSGTGPKIAVIDVAPGTEDGIDLRALMTRCADEGSSTRRGRSAEEKADVVGGVAEGGLSLIAGRRS